MNVLSCGPKASDISGISDAISPRYIRKNPRRACAACDDAICSKNRKVVPYHRNSPNTRNGSRLRSPSPIMAPVFTVFVLGSLNYLNLKQKAKKYKQKSSHQSYKTQIKILAYRGLA